MDWQAITPKELDLIVRQSLEKTPFELQKYFKKVSCDFFEVYIKRTECGIQEKVFVIGKTRKYYLFFDDVEDDFGVTRIVYNDEPITIWELFPDLKSALEKLTCSLG